MSDNSRRLTRLMEHGKGIYVYDGFAEAGRPTASLTGGQHEEFRLPIEGFHHVSQPDYYGDRLPQETGPNTPGVRPNWSRRSTRGQRARWQQCSVARRARCPLTMGKGVTSGYFPLSAIAVGEDLYAALDKGSEAVGTLAHASTVAAHPVGVVAALKTIDRSASLWLDHM